MNNFIANSMVKEIRQKVDEIRQSFDNVSLVYDLKFYDNLHQALGEITAVLDSLESELSTEEK